jgi:hypothetical protein
MKHASMSVGAVAVAVVAQPVRSARAAARVDYSVTRLADLAAQRGTPLFQVA